MLIEHKRAGVLLVVGATSMQVASGRVARGEGARERASLREREPHEPHASAGDMAGAAERV
jgi:hypothetical protein